MLKSISFKVGAFRAFSFSDANRLIVEPLIKSYLSKRVIKLKNYLQIKFVIKLNVLGEEVLHDDNANALSILLQNIQPIKLGEKRVWILIHVEVIATKHTVQEVGLFARYSFNDKLVVLTKPHQSSRATRIDDGS